MKLFEFILPVLVAGSVWGLVEILPLPVAVMIAAGVLMLTLARRLLNVPGSSLAIGLVVCFYKTYSVSFFACNWAGVLSLAASYDVLASLLLRQAIWRAPKTALIGAASALMAMPVFLGAVFIAGEPIWISEGWPRVASYGFETILPAAVLALITAPLGFFIAERVQSRRIVRGKPVHGLFAGAVAVSWLIASVHVFL